MLQRAGQMCTKPGVILISEGSDGDEVVRAMADRVDAESSVPLLNSAVRHQYVAGTQSMSTLPGVTLRGGALSEGGEDSDPVRPALFEATTSEFSGAESLTEVFGPTSIVLRYRDSDDARALLAKLEPALVGGVHAADEDPHAADLMQALLPGVGRIVWNGATTGLAVGWATHHGGSYPASTSLHSSVGASAIRRWLRPVSYQGVPDQFLPAELAPAGAVR
jgi:NADP-dependent aldehyde dehydrogenase